MIIRSVLDKNLLDEQMPTDEQCTGVCGGNPPLFSRPREISAQTVAALTLQRHLFSCLLQGLYRQVVRRLPEVVTVDWQDSVAHPKRATLVRSEPRENLGDKDRHPILAPSFDTDP